MKRSIGVCILLYFITCGLYSIYWIIKLNDELNDIAGNEDYTTGGVVFLLTLITCGIYGIYWAYKMGLLVDVINGEENGNTGVIYLVLSIASYVFGFTTLVNYCLMQDVINKNAAE